MSDRELTVQELADGLALWEEHKPQSGSDWIGVAWRVLEAGGDTSKSSPLFAALVEQTRRLGLAESAGVALAEAALDYVSSPSPAMGALLADAVGGFRAALRSGA